MYALKSLPIDLTFLLLTHLLVMHAVLVLVFLLLPACCHQLWTSVPWVPIVNFACWCWWWHYFCFLVTFEWQGYQTMQRLWKMKMIIAHPMVRDFQLSVLSCFIIMDSCSSIHCRTWWWLGRSVLEEAVVNQEKLYWMVWVVGIGEYLRQNWPRTSEPLMPTLCIV